MEEQLYALLQEVPQTHWMAEGVLLLLLVIQMHFYFRYFNKLPHYDKKRRKGKIKFANEKPPVSVIICAQNEAENLEKYLPSVLEQDYPNFQVVVVNDGSTDQSSELLDRLSKQYDNLYHTFLPMDAKYTSRKKMCITVGIKAARYNHLVLLDADCEPNSKQWLTSIMSNYTPETDIVLGYSKTTTGSSFLGKMIRYDSITNAMRYMGFALRGRPYKGMAQNISYKKELFFQEKGFHKHLDLTSGDDNLFIQEIAQRKNTRVEFSVPALTTCHREETKKSYFYQKEEKLKAARHYKKDILASILTENISRILFVTAFLAMLVFSIVEREWMLTAATAVIFLFRFITQAVVIRRSAKLLTEKPFFLMIPIFDVLQPIISGYMLTIGNIGRRNSYKWQ